MVVVRRSLLSVLLVAACAQAPVPPSHDPAVAAPATEVAAPAPADEETAQEPEPPGPLQVAITVDDLPAHGPRVDGMSWLSIHEQLLSAFAAHNVPQVYGFVNADKLEGQPELRTALEAWVAAGHPLGNHTYSHPSLRKLGLDDYYDDIAKNEALLDALALGGTRTPTFRYPYLLEGMSREDTTAIRDHLNSRGYRVAPVTVDFYDWAFNAAFARCESEGNTKAVAAIKKTYMAHAIEMLAWSDAAAQALYGRRVPQILLLHSGAINAEMIDSLLEAMETHGAQWVSLDEALSDPAYAESYLREGRNQGTLLDQKIDADGGPHPPRHTHPRALLEAMCLSGS